MNSGRGSGKTPERVMRMLQDSVVERGQNATAKAIVIPLSSLQKFIKGTSEPTTATLQKLADYFNVEFKITISPKKPPHLA